MTLTRTAMKPGTKGLRNTKPMNRGTSTLSRGTGIARGTSTMSRGKGIKPGVTALARNTESKVTELQLSHTGNIDLAVTVPATKKTAKKRSAPMKTTRPKMTAIRASAKDEECTLRFSCCNLRTDTTVLCHRNGAGGGMKAPDTDAAYGCYACHQVLDGHAKRPEGFTREAMLARFDEAVRLTHYRLAVKGLIRFLADGRVEEVPKAEKATHKNKSQNLLQADSGPKSHQLYGQSMTSKILPQNDSVARGDAHLYVAFPFAQPSRWVASSAFPASRGAA